MQEWPNYPDPFSRWVVVGNRAYWLSAGLLLLAAALIVWGR